MLKKGQYVVPNNIGDQIAHLWCQLVIARMVVSLTHGTPYCIMGHGSLYTKNLFRKHWVMQNCLLLPQKGLNSSKDVGIYWYYLDSHFFAGVSELFFESVLSVFFFEFLCWNFPLSNSVSMMRRNNRNFSV